MEDGLSLAETIAAARPHVVAALAAQFRDLDLAEEGVDAAVEKMLSLEAPPDNPRGWLFIAAKRKILDLLRRRDAEARAIEAAALDRPMADILTLPDPIPDERLRLMFICCHPAISPTSRVALTLRIVCGVEAGDIARLLLAREGAVRQRITRAKAKIREANIPFELPPRRRWGERVASVLTTLETTYQLAYAEGGEGVHGDFAPEVERLAVMLVELMPDDAEVLGFAALVTLTRSREKARIDVHGAMVPLSEQDARLWDEARIEQARSWLDQAAGLEVPGRYQLMAAIHLAHAMRRWHGVIDWAAIAALYDALWKLAPDDVVAINRAVAIGEARGAVEGLAAMPEEREGFLPWYAAQAHLLAMAGEADLAAKSYDAAIALASGPGKSLLERKRSRL